MRHWLLGTLGILAALAIVLPLAAAEVIPPTPKAYFNDYAGITSPTAQQKLNAELVQFERETSNQLVVVIYPTMQSNSSIEDYTVRVAQKWGVGQKGKSNGAVLFVFSQDRKLYLQAGYGLEGALPDALGRRIIANEIVPSFKTGQYAAGLQKGIHAIMAATKGEYQGTGKTVHENNSLNDGQAFAICVVLALVAFFILLVIAGALPSTTNYDRRGRRRYYDSGWTSSNSSSSWSSGGGGGGFSGGGGSFGGGGSGGSW